MLYDDYDNLQIQTADNIIKLFFYFIRLSSSKQIEFNLQVNFFDYNIIYENKITCNNF